MALRIHFTEVDLARTRVAKGPDPLWEVAASLHRLQSRQGRWAYADWYRTARGAVREQGLERPLRETLLRLYPRAAYFPDFLTPPQALGGGPGGSLDSGLEAILATEPRRVEEEMGLLLRRRAVGSPSGSSCRAELAELPERKALVSLLRAYHDTVIAPHGDRMEAQIEAERTARLRALLDGGVEGMLASLGPMMRWQRPVLHVTYPVEDRDLHLGGRGLILVPSYFCWGAPVSLADPGLPPVLCYAVLHEPPAPVGESLDVRAGKPLTDLLGRARAAALYAASAGATTGEIARIAGVSASSASRHATALRNAGLITTTRQGPTVLHTLTPVGASMLRAATGGPAGRQSL